MSDAELARLIEPLTRHFFGEPNRRLSTKGTYGSESRAR